MILFDRHRKFRNRLSAYIDGELSNDEVRSLDGHLESCDECRLELDQMRATVNAMRSLPEVEAPRSFRLTPAMVAKRRPVDAWSPAPPLMNGMRMAAAGLTMALAVVFVVDLGGPSRSTNDDGLTGGINQLGIEAPAATGLPPTAAAGAGGQAEQFADGADNDVEFRAFDGGVQPADADAPAAPEVGEATDRVPENYSTSTYGDEVLEPVPESEGDFDELPAPVPESDSDFDELLAAEIGLGIALGIVVVGGAGMTLASRSRGRRV